MMFKMRVRTAMNFGIESTWSFFKAWLCYCNKKLFFVFEQNIQIMVAGA